MEIRKTRPEDLEAVMEIYHHARGFMAENGNPDQWGTVHPPKAMIVKDIEDGRSYVCVENEQIAAVFYFAVEDDPTYYQIFEGSWKNNKPYAVVHRIASAGTVKGAGTFCLNWAAGQCDNIRIDTHKDNAIMQKTLEKCGFAYCGIIYLANGDERIAYQKVGYGKQKAFLSSLDFMKLGQAINHEQWQSAAMIIQRMTRNAREAGITDFDRLLAGIRQNINRKNVHEAKQILALVIHKRVKLINEINRSNQND